MLPKYCEHCRRLHVPQPQGLGSVFCQGCVKQAEQAYVLARRYLQAHPGATVPKIASALALPSVLIYYLSKFGRLGPELSQRTPQAMGLRRGCPICHITLKVHEDVYCTPCNTVVEKRMHTTRAARPTERGTASSFGSYRRRGESRPGYGFSRSLNSRS